MTIEEMNKIRLDRGYTYQEISDSSGVALSTVQKIFGKITTSPRYTTMQKLEKLFVNEPHSPYNYNVSKTEISNHINLSAKKQGEFTIKDYLTWPEDEKIELIDGVIYNMAAPTNIHQILILQMATQINNQIRKNGGDCIPMISPTDVQIDSDDKTMLQPDFMIVCDRSKIDKMRVIGAPDFIVEVISPSTRKKDVFIKQNKYMTSGVCEYWTVDLNDNLVTVYLFEDGKILQYDLNQKIPINIYDGGIMVDFKEITVYIRDVVGDIT